MVLVFVFGMTDDVGIILWRSSFWFCLNAPLLEALVASMLVRQTVGEMRSWDVIVLFDFNDWEFGVVASFLILLYSNIPWGEGGDILSWGLKGSGDFYVSSFYNALRGPHVVPFPWKSIWCVKTQKRISFFWMTTWGRILMWQPHFVRIYISSLMLYVSV